MQKLYNVEYEICMYTYRYRRTARFTRTKYNGQPVVKRAQECSSSKNNMILRTPKQIQSICMSINYPTSIIVL